MKKYIISIILIFSLFVMCACSAPQELSPADPEPENLLQEEIDQGKSEINSSPDEDPVDEDAGGRQIPFEEEVAAIYQSYYDGPNAMSLGEIKQLQEPLDDSIFSGSDFYKTFSCMDDMVYELSYYDDGLDVDYDSWPPFYITMNANDFGMSKEEIMDYCLSLGGIKYEESDGIEMIPVASVPADVSLDICFMDDEFFFAGLSSI